MTDLLSEILLAKTKEELIEDLIYWRGEFEIARRASRLFEDASNAWMERALKAEAKNGTD